MRPLNQYVAGVEKAVERLSSANDDESSAWPLVLDVLAWLYRAEERARQTNANYYADRAASREGQTLGGLIYFRGEVEHAAVEDPYAPTWLKGELFVSNGTEWKPAVMHVSDGTEWEPAEIFIGGLGFPHLHPGARPDKHGRKRWYEEFVAGRSLSEPPTHALQFLRQLT